MQYITTAKKLHFKASTYSCQKKKPHYTIRKDLLAAKKLSKIFQLPRHVFHKVKSKSLNNVHYQATLTDTKTCKTSMTRQAITSLSGGLLLRGML